jgi:hypothetical protein
MDHTPPQGRRGRHVSLISLTILQQQPKAKEESAVTLVRGGQECNLMHGRSDHLTEISPPGAFIL